jgi:protein MPE1
MDMSQIVPDIPELQAQIAQISQMLQNPSLPNHVRQTTEMQHNHLQIQLQHAHAISAALAVATSFQQQQQAIQNSNLQYNNMPGYQKPDYRGWTNQFSNQQVPAQDSAYQRAPINNRRRPVKRDRPSDFLEVGAENAKVARYWE